MPHYFFDFCDESRVIRDLVGLHCSDLGEARSEASRSLLSFAAEVIPESLRRMLIIEVRSEQGPVFRAALRYEELLSNPATSGKSIPLFELRP